METPRRAALRNYLMEVMRDLVARGVVRRAYGQRLTDVLAAEMPKIAREMEQDLAAIGLEIGGSLLGAAARAFVGFLAGAR